MTGNNIIIEAWNGVLYEKFCRFRHLLIEGLAQHSEAALSRCNYAPGDRVIDIGCGFGDSTLRIAGSVGPAGEVVGVDCARNFVCEAEAEAARSGVTNARFATADAETDDLYGPYDHAFARFGTMFFLMPGAAMRNIQRALRPGGLFTQVVWRKREDNPWLHEAEMRVREIVPVVAHEETDQVHCGPGPFSMSSADMVGDMLKAAGFERITFERHDCDICIGHDMNDAIKFAMALGPAGEIIRLAGEQGEQHRPAVIKALREAFAPYQRENGIWAPSSTWIVTAAKKEVHA